MKAITKLFGMAAMAVSAYGCQPEGKQVMVKNANGTASLKLDEMDYRVEAFNGNMYQTEGNVEYYNGNTSSAETVRFTDKATGKKVVITGPSITTECDNCPVPTQTKISGPRP